MPMKSLAFSMRKAKFLRFASACRIGVTFTRAAIQPTTRPFAVALGHVGALHALVAGRGNE